MRSGLNIIESVSALMQWVETAEVSSDTEFVLVPLLSGDPKECYDLKGSAYILGDSVIINGLDTVNMYIYRNFTDIYNHLCSSSHQPKLSIVGNVELFSDKFLLQTFIKWYRAYRVKGVAIVADNLDDWKRFDISGGHIASYINNDFKTVDLFKVGRVDVTCNDKGQLKPRIYVNVNGEHHACSIPEDNMGVLVKKHIARGATLLVSRKFGWWKYLSTIQESVAGDTGLLDATAKCPFCGSPTVWDCSMTELSCSNEECCERQKAMSFRFFATFGMTSQDIKKLEDAGFNKIETVLGMSAENVEAVFGTRHESVYELIDEIRTKPNLSKLMMASGCFDNIDRDRLSAILDTFDDAAMNDFCNGWYNPLFDKHSASGGRISKVMYDFASDVRPFHEFAEKYNLPILPPKPFADDWKGKFAGQNIAFSGLNRSMNKVLRKMVRMEGGKIVGIVTKRTSLVVANKPKAKARKIMDARFFLVPIVPLDKFVINLRYKKHYDKHKDSE